MTINTSSPGFNSQITIPKFECLENPQNFRTLDAAENLAYKAGKSTIWPTIQRCTVYETSVDRKNM